MEVWLNRVLREGDTILLEMTAFNEAEQEVFCQPIAEQTARLIEEVLSETPFKPTKPGLYYRSIWEISEGPDWIFTVVIHKGRSRVKRSIPTNKVLYLTLWNVFHYQALPSKLPEKRRLR